MLDERKLSVLRAIVADYVSSREPVGSKNLVERHSLGVSPATIRNDMAALEEEGYIHAPHTSAGRIPTDKGYRLFVDHLVQLRPLSGSERRAIESFLSGPVDLDDAVERTVRLLSQLTRQLAVVQYPTLARSSLRHVELVQLSAQRLLVVTIFETGAVEQRLLECPELVDPDALLDVRDRINRALVGADVATVLSRIDEVAAAVEPDRRPLADAVVTAIRDAVSTRREDKVVFAGTGNLARQWDGTGDSLDQVLEMLEEQMVLLRLLGNASEHDRLRVRIGTENAETGLMGTSVVAAGYGATDKVFAHLGVVGPTRMDYSSTMSAVQAVAQYLGRIVTDSN